MAGQITSAMIKARPTLDLAPAPAPLTSTSKRAQRLKLGVDQGSRDALLYVPASYEPTMPSPLVVMLHGASACGADCDSVFSRQELEAGRVIVLLPDSRGRTWDVIRGGFGADVQYLDTALAKVFREYSVQPDHICCAGFSDGASYALSLGLFNSSSRATSAGPTTDHGLFTHIMALSPGFMVAPSRVTSPPRIFVSHGMHDEVLHIDRCSRRIIPKLASMGLPPQLVNYHEFNGSHTIPASVASRALTWFLSG